MSGDGGLYADPRLYESVFSFRDVRGQVDAIEAWYADRRPGRPRRALEVAAGPAAHAIELGRRGTRVTALDISPAMCTYARRRARESHVDLHVVQADVVAFRIPRRRFDLGFAMLDSASHLLDLDAMVGHLRSVAAHLEAGGLYVMEMSHPAEADPGSAPTQDRWQVTVGGKRLVVRWTAGAFDPVTRITENRIAVTIVEPGRRHTVRDRISLRRWTPTELDAAVRLAGGLDLVARHGSFEPDAPFGQSASEWRMISVLQRRPPAAERPR